MRVVIKKNKKLEKTMVKNSKKYFCFRKIAVFNNLKFCKRNIFKNVPKKFWNNEYLFDKRITLYLFFKFI